MSPVNRVGIDTSWMPQTGRMDGLNRYTRTLVDIINSSNEIEAVHLANGDYKNRRTVLGFLKFVKLQQLTTPVHALRETLDVVHYPGNIIPLIDRRKRPFKRVVTVHDLMFFKGTRKEDVYYRAIFKLGIGLADGIVFVSDSTAREFTARFPDIHVPSTVIPNPVSSAIHYDPLPLPRLEGRRYVVAQGHSAARKNLGVILRTFEALRALMDVDLILYGTDEQAQQLSAEYEGVYYMQAPSDVELARLYSHASCTWVLSLDEGFGLPVAEALTCGSPVVASDVGGIPFVSGGYAELVSPNDVDTIVARTEKIISENNDGYRFERVRYSQRFSTRTFLSDLLQFYRTVVG